MEVVQKVVKYFSQVLYHITLLVSYINHFSHRYADHIAIGDEVLVLKDSKLKPVKVMDVSSFMMQGNLIIQWAKIILFLVQTIHSNN